MAGNLNNYRVPERELYRSAPLQSSHTSARENQDCSKKKQQFHLETFFSDLIQDDLYLFDPMNQNKLTTFHSYTFMASSHRFQSILDKIFTLFPADYCERTVILDFDQYTDVGLSDHRAVVTQISL
jgi:hypothetical protein